MNRPPLTRAVLDAIAATAEIAAWNSADNADIRRTVQWVRAMRQWRGEQDRLLLPPFMEPNRGE